MVFSKKRIFFYLLIIVCVPLFTTSATFVFPLKDGLKISEQEDRAFLVPFQHLDDFLPEDKRRDPSFELSLRQIDYMENPSQLLEIYRIHFQGKKLNSIQYPPIDSAEPTPDLVSLITCCVYGLDRVSCLLQKTYQMTYQLEDIQKISIVKNGEEYTFGTSFRVFQKIVMALLSYLHYQKNIILHHPIGVVQTQSWQSEGYHLAYFWDDNGIVPFVAEKDTLSQTGVRYGGMPSLNMVTNEEGEIIDGPALLLRRCNEVFPGVRVDLVPPKPLGETIQIVNRQQIQASNFDAGVKLYNTLGTTADSAILVHNQNLHQMKLPEVADSQAAVVCFPQSDEEFVDQFVECMIEEINAIDYERRDMILPLIEVFDLPSIEYKSLHEKDGVSAGEGNAGAFEDVQLQFQEDKKSILSKVEERRRYLLESIISTANPERDMQRKKVSEKKNKKHAAKSRGGRHKKRGGEKPAKGSANAAATHTGASAAAGLGSYVEEKLRDLEGKRVKYRDFRKIINSVMRESGQLRETMQEVLNPRQRGSHQNAGGATIVKPHGGDQVTQGKYVANFIKSVWDKFLSESKEFQP